MLATFGRTMVAELGCERDRTIVSAWRHLRAIALLPTMVLALIPSAIVLLTRPVHIGWGLPTPLAVLPPIFGGLFIVIGLGLMGWTVSLFATEGQGTLAPWDATRRLVARGAYRHVRNPMITGVLCVLLGEVALLGSLPLLFWFALFFLANALYIPLAEEPGLERRFGEEYLLYRRSVPRWIPRLTPWNPDSEGPGRT